MTGTKTEFNRRLLDALACEPVDRAPLWIMRQAGRYLPEYRALRQQESNFMDFIRSAEMTCEAALQPLRRYPLDAAILFSDILTIPNAYNRHNVRFKPGMGPIIEPRLSGPRAVSALQPLTPIDFAPYADCARTLVDEVGDRMPVIGFCGSPWTLACYMIEGAGSKTGFQRARAFLREEHAAAHLLLDRLAQDCATSLMTQAAAGVNLVQIFDSWGGVLPPSLWREFSAQYIKRVIELLRYQKVEIPVIAFVRSSSPVIVEVLAGDHSADALGVDYTVDLEAIVPQLPAGKAIQGNLDPSLLVNGNSQVLSRAVSKQLEAGSKAPGYIFNLGHGISPDASPDALGEVVAAVTGGASN